MAATLPCANLVAAIWIFSLTWLKCHARLVSPVGPRLILKAHACQIDMCKSDARVQAPMGRDPGPIIKDTCHWSLTWPQRRVRLVSPVGPRAHIESSRDQSRMAATLPFANVVADIWIFSWTWLKCHARLGSPVGPRAHIESHAWQIGMCKSHVRVQAPRGRDPGPIFKDTRHWSLTRPQCRV